MINMQSVNVDFEMRFTCEAYLIAAETPAEAIKRGSYQVITTSLLRVRTYELEDGERVSTGEWLEVT